MLTDEQEMELINTIWDMLSEKVKDQFVSDIADSYELMTFDEAMEAASDSKSI